MLVPIAAWTDKRKSRLAILAMVLATLALVTLLAWLMRISGRFK